MPEFLELISPHEAFDRLEKILPVHLEAEDLPTEKALGRVTAAPISAPYSLPSFDRSSVDGFAVRATETFGANDSLPAYLSLIGEVPMGEAPGFSLTAFQCCAIHTGGMLPVGADAVVMLEHTQGSRPLEIEILRAVAIGENVIKEGEDVITGQEVVPVGTRLRPAEIGGLMALGILHLKVTRKPRVAIISSGDEIVAPGDELTLGRIRDVNSFSLSAVVEETGGIPIRYGIVPDNFEKLFDVASQALSECDLVVITAGSSASVRDLTSQVINQLGNPGVLIHGVNVKPGKPTILGMCQGKAVIGLPGNPVSALVIAGLFLVPAIQLLAGINRDRPKPGVMAKLSLNLASQAGREDWIAVCLVRGEEGYTARPVFGKSNLIFTLIRADGLIRIPPESTGLNAGETVQVFLI